jgi:DNA-3-methyladenine glycosylase I
MVAYHDEEWGVPQHDDNRLFEKICLEGAQAGLSWSTILAKREGYRAAFAGFDPVRVARFTPARVERLMANAAIVRPPINSQIHLSNEPCSSATASSARAFPIADLIFRRFRTIP